MINPFKKLNSNEKIIASNMIFTFIIKGASLVISLLTIPLFVSYFNNNEVLGVWYTLLSVLTWFLTFDFGIGNGIRNHLVRAFANDDYQEAKRYISSGIFSNVIITLVLTVIGAVLILTVNLNSLLHIDSSVIPVNTLKTAAIIVFVSIMMRMLNTTVGAIFYSLQKSFVNNLLSLCTSVLQLLFVLLFHFENINDAILYLALGYMVFVNAPSWFAAIVVFQKKLASCRPGITWVTKRHIKNVLGMGGIFFACQILFMLMMNTSEILITYFFGPDYTTEYTFYYRLTSLLAVMVTLAMTPIWSIVTKALAEKDYIWLAKLYRNLKFVGGVAIVLEFFLVPFLPFLMDLWLGKNSITVHTLTALSFACFGSTFIYTGILSTMVCGMARMKLQAIFYGGGVIIKYVFIFIMIRYTANWDIIVWSNMIALIPYCLAQQINLDRYFKPYRQKNHASG